jgi:hypothetical protein
MRPIATSLVILATTSLAACAGNPKPGEAGYSYNLSGSYRAEFVVEGTPYRGDMDLATAPGGVVSGRFTVVGDGPVVGTVEGTIVTDSLAFVMPYEQVNGCAGTVEGSAAISEGGAGFAGPVQVEDSCGGMLSATLTVER